jgi:hypothetical protein
MAEMRPDMCDPVANSMRAAKRNLALPSAMMTNNPTTWRQPIAITGGIILEFLACPRLKSFCPLS